MAYGVIGKSMPIGFPGQVARQSFNIVEPHIIDKTAPVTMYGAPVVMTDAGKVRAIANADTAAKIYGFTVRPDAVQLGGDNPVFGDSGIPDTAQTVDVLIRGYMNVRVYGDTAPVQGGAVYVTKAAADDIPAGAVVADSSVTGAVAVPNGIFMGGVDAEGVAQIRIL